MGKLWNCCEETFGEYIAYTTKKELRVENRFVAGVYLTGMLTIAVYVIAYTLIIEKGYQLVGYPTGHVATKVKGIAFDYRGIDTNDSFYESVDLVQPSIEMDGLFLATAMILTWQSRDICAGEGECENDDDCIEGVNDYYGIQNGECQGGYCQEYRWCPAANDTLAESNLIYGVENFTIFLKIAIEFKEFSVSLVNTKDKLGDGSLIEGYNLFTVKDILDECGIEMSEIRDTGVLVSGDITYYCDFDPDNDCDPYPKFQWHREDIDEAAVSRGFNFKKLYYSRNNQQSAVDRLMVNYYGIRFRFSIQGNGGKFDLGTFSTTLGSGIALTAISVVITEMLLRHCIAERSFYTERRMELVTLEEEEDWVRRISEHETPAEHETPTGRSRMVKFI